MIKLDKKNIIIGGITLLGVIVGIQLATKNGAPIVSVRKRKYRYSKYPLIWDIVLRGEALTENDYNYYTTSGLKSVVNAKNTKPFSDKLLTQMKIGQVIEYQSMSRSGIGQLWATGQFQIIPSTLKGTYGKAGLNLDSLYNIQNQTKMADALIDMESTLPKYLNKKIEDTDANLKKASLDIATIWSSIGVPYDVVNNKGIKRLKNQSYYSSDKASVSTEEVQAILRKQRNS